MGTKLRDQSMSTDVTTPLERICLWLLAVITVTWFLWAGITGDTNHDTKPEEGTIPPVVCTDPSEACP